MRASRLFHELHVARGDGSYTRVLARLAHFNVTERPTATWTAQQHVDAFPDDSAPAYLLRDRDQVYGQRFRHRVKGMGIEEILTAPQSPWQNPFAERLMARSGASA